MFKRGKNTQPTQPTPDQQPGRVPGKPLIASAAMVSRQQLRRVNKKQDSVDEAWELLDKVPEIRRAVTWRSAACSRARLYVARQHDNDTTGTPEPVDDERLQAPLRELTGEQEGQAQMLARMSLHLDVVGETWLVGFDHPAVGGRRWQVCSRDEFDARSRPRVRLPETDEWLNLNMEHSVFLRIWRPHGRRAAWADSPVWALRYVARELIGLSDRVSAENDSRLAGAGILKVPNELTMVRPEQSSGTPNPVDGDDFTSSLMETMMTPLQDRESASAVVPAIVRGPSQHLGAMEHMSFSSPLDGQILPLRDSGLQRIAHGMDVEPEVVQGNQNDNHWNAMFSDESGIKLHIKPLLDLLCSAITKQYYRPAITTIGFPNSAEYAIWPDITDLVVRPNRGPDAVTLFDRRIISANATRKENGFSDDDAPSPEESRQWMALDLAKTLPDLAPTLLPLVGLDVNEGDVANSGSTRSGGGGSAPAAPPNSDNGGRVDPPTPDASPAVAASNEPDPWLVATLEVGALRALDKAGKWVLGRSRANRQHRDIPANRIHTRIKVEQGQLDDALTGAYTELQAAVPDQTCLHDLVDLYVRGLLIQQRPHDRDQLARMVAASQCMQQQEEVSSGV